MIKFEKWKHEEFLGESEPEVPIMKYSDSGFFFQFLEVIIGKFYHGLYDTLVKILLHSIIPTGFKCQI